MSSVVKQTMNGTIKKDLGGHPAGTGITGMVLANDDGTYQVMLNAFKGGANVLDETYTDKASYQAKLIDIMEPENTSGKAPIASAQTGLAGEDMDEILEGVQKGASVREAVLDVMDDDES